MKKTIEKSNASAAATRKGRRAAHGSAWVCVKDKLPNHLEQVIAIYAGVYDHRIVTFWRDDGGGAHFGHPCDPHGKGSQPATHWHPLPEMPNDQAQRPGEPALTITSNLYEQSETQSPGSLQRMVR